MFVRASASSGGGGSISGSAVRRNNQTVTVTAEGAEIVFDKPSYFVGFGSYRSGSVTTPPTYQVFLDDGVTPISDVISTPLNTVLAVGNTGVWSLTNKIILKKLTGSNAAVAVQQMWIIEP